MRQRFTGLDSLRFYAALSVIIFHANGIRQMYDPNYVYTRDLVAHFFLGGWDAVTLFFVLSGFLITYLLLKERVQTGAIDLKRFYLRRILRIWPLYFIVLLIGLPILTQLPLLANLMMLTFFSNVAAIVYPTYYLAHLWSIACEEQFYVLWSLLIQKVRHNIPRFVLVVIVAKLILVSALYGLLYRGYDAPILGDSLKFLLYFRFEAMLIGAVAAWLVFNKHPVLWRIYQRRTQVLLLSLGLLIIVSDHDPSALFDPLIALVFAGIVLNVATNPLALFRPTFAGEKHLGDLSFGMYMYHFPILNLLIVAGVPMSGLGYYTISVVVTIGISTLSYLFIERPFLNLKERLGKPLARNNPSELSSSVSFL